MERIAWEAFYGLPSSIIREEYYVVLEVWDARQELVPLREFLIWQTEKAWEMQIACARGVSEGVLFVLPSSC